MLFLPRNARRGQRFARIARFVIAALLNPLCFTCPGTRLACRLVLCGGAISSLAALGTAASSGPEAEAVLKHYRVAPAASRLFSASAQLSAVHQPQPGEPAAGAPAAVAAYLQQHGVDPDRLVGEQPKAWARLTLPLAEVLVEFLRGREGVRLITTTPTAAEYLARLDFLHNQV